MNLPNHAQPTYSRAAQPHAAAHQRPAAHGQGRGPQPTRHHEHGGGQSGEGALGRHLHGQGAGRPGQVRPQGEEHERADAGQGNEEPGTSHGQGQEAEGDGKGAEQEEGPDLGGVPLPLEHAPEGRSAQEEGQRRETQAESGEAGAQQEAQQVLSGRWSSPGLSVVGLLVSYSGL